MQLPMAHFVHILTPRQPKSSHQVSLQISLQAPCLRARAQLRLNIALSIPALLDIALELRLILTTHRRRLAVSPFPRLGSLDQVYIRSDRRREVVGAELGVGPAGAALAVRARPVFGEVVEEAAC